MHNVEGKMTEMYLEVNQACIEAEANVAVLMTKNNDLKCECSDLEFRVEQYRKFLDYHFSKEPTGFDDWKREFQEWKAKAEGVRVKIGKPKEYVKPNHWQNYALELQEKCKHLEGQVEDLKRVATYNRDWYMEKSSEMNRHIKRAKILEAIESSAFVHFSKYSVMNLDEWNALVERCIEHGGED